MDVRRIQLVYFAGCPNVDTTRELLRDALRGFNGIDYSEVDTSASDAPEDLRQWGSPTILVDGKDVAAEPPSGRCCRLYEEHDTRGRGVPAMDLIVRALAKEPR